MHTFYKKLADQITVTGDYQAFNNKPTIHDALLDVSDEYETLSPTAQCLTSHYVWAILHEHKAGNGSIDFDTLTDNVYTDKISAAEFRKVDFEYYYFELDPSTSDVRITDESDEEVCFVNIRTMLNDGTISAPHMNGIHDGLVKLNHIQDVDVLLIKEPTIEYS